jgi:hypothetical protein
MSYNGQLAARPPGPLPDKTWTVWLGPVPSALTTFAVDSLKTEAEHPYGYEWTMTYNDEQVMAIKQHHTWTYHGGKLIKGICIPGITLYRPEKIGITGLENDFSEPNPDIAWFDNGAEPAAIDWPVVGGLAVVMAIVIALFIFGLRRFRSKP